MFRLKGFGKHVMVVKSAETGAVKYVNVSNRLVNRYVYN